MIKKIITPLFLALAMSVMTGCGGGGDTAVSASGTGSPVVTASIPIGTGTYVDEAVSGVRYECGSETGVTDEKGSFRFEKGETCRFFLGDVLLRTIDAQHLKDGMVFVEDDPTVAAVLQSFDEDPNDDVITIPEDVVETLEAMNVGELPKNQADLELLIDEMKKHNDKLSIRPVDYETALARVEAEKERLEEKEPQKVVTATETEAAKTDIAARAENPIAPLTDEEFNKLTETDRIYVAKKLYATLFKGRGLPELREEVNSGSFMSDFRKLLATEVAQPDLDKIEKPDEELFRDDTGGGDAITRKKGEADRVVISRMIYTKLGKSYYSDWMAFKLNQTILLSPGWEVDTMIMFPRFILNNFDRLREWINEDRPIKEIVKDHMVSKENWARFRSPEDNGREMPEIWLYDFDDSHVPLAAKALKNWKFYTYYERPYDKYVFVNGVGDEENNETVYLLGRALRTGDDFFDAVVNNDHFIPTVVDRIVGRFFPTFSPERKAEITQAIVATQPKTFKEIFDAILFSKAYLLESDKVKTVEETVYSLIDTLDFTMGAYTISSIDGALHNMNQSIMTYKLGRDDKVPTDTISMNYYAKLVRELVLANTDDSANYPDDNGVDMLKMAERYDHSSVEAFVNDMFLDVLGRNATPLELETLVDHFKNTEIGYLSTNLADLSEPTCQKYMTMIVYDYMSRLTELYQYRKVSLND